MQATHYALAALASDLTRPVDGGGLVGAALADAYSQHANELRLVFGLRRVRRTLVVGTRPASIYPLDVHARPRRNVTTRFDAWHGRRVAAVRVGERDRVLAIDLDDGAQIVALLYGPRANVVVVERDAAGEAAIADAFLSASRLVGTEAPTVRPAPVPETAEAFAARLPLGGTDVGRLRRAWPLFDDLLAAEALARADAPDASPAPDARPFAESPPFDDTQLFDACRAVHADALAASAPAVLWDGESPLGVTLMPVRASAVARVFGTDRLVRIDPYESVGDALRVFGRRRAAHVAAERRRATLTQRLDTALDAAVQRAETMLAHLTQPSRADALEREAHLLMASPDVTQHVAADGTATVVVPDLLGDGALRSIAVDAARPLHASATDRYERARRLRTARAHAEARYDAADADAAALRLLRSDLDACRDGDALDRFACDHADVLARLAPVRAAADERLPYHRVPLDHGYEAWIARSAADGDTLTLRHARPFDLWLHARGVAGAHVVLRLRGRTDTPPKAVVERAAGLAAGASKGRTSALVPVTVTPRKWVRKRKGDPPGQVVVEREEVLVVPPLAPGAA